MIHDLMTFLREVFHRGDLPADHPIRRSRELITESNLRRDSGERLLKRVEAARSSDLEDRESAWFAHRLNAIKDSIKADDIAPLPRIGNDNGGRG